MTEKNRVGEKIADCLGLARHYIEFILKIIGGWVFACEIRDVFWPNLSFETFQKKNLGIKKTIPNSIIMIIFVIIALVIRGIYDYYTLNKCDIKLGKSNITLSIRRGNILRDKKGNVRRDGTLLIGINDQLKIDQYDQSRRTINNQLIEMFNSDSWLKDKFRERLAGAPKLEMGSYIDIRNVDSSNDKPDIIFTVMSGYTQEVVASTSITYIETALNKVFERSSIGCLNNTMYCPILGNSCGLGSSFSREQLILTIAKCFIVNSVNSAIAEHLIIIVRPETHKQLNKRKLKRMIENMVELSDVGVLQRKD